MLLQENTYINQYVALSKYEAFRKYLNFHDNSNQNFIKIPPKTTAGTTTAIRHKAVIILSFTILILHIDALYFDRAKLIYAIPFHQNQANKQV